MQTAARDTLAAAPKKLKSGEWGAIVDSETVIKGQRLQITTRSGKSWTARVRKVLWSGNGKAIVATTSGGGSRRRRSECTCGHADDPLSMGFGRYAGQVITCPDCGGKLEVA